ncbi:hypothetical protein [Cnuella takakiae]|uniref:hypothetical protein n=1 Tax=Cnuella takakiae TaxID=1302690 RepID=UPI000932A644|nr:hypothetical protein [Cnuella takakiae]OLY92618.1 hypothetical protein BUE76_12500 [Cnuella takakiae]
MCLANAFNKPAFDKYEKPVTHKPVEALIAVLENKYMGPSRHWFFVFIAAKLPECLELMHGEKMGSVKMAMR